MRTYQAVLFDFDGVLADTEQVHFACWAEALRPVGVELDWETYQEHYIGVTDRVLIEYLCSQTDPPLHFDRLWRQFPHKQQLFRQRMLVEPPISAQVIDFIKSLQEYKLAVVTSSARSEIEPALQRAGIAGCFGAIVCAEDVRRHKPAPDAFLLAAKRLGVERVLVVEDSAPGLEGGTAAGFDVVEIREARRMPEVVRAKLAGNSR
jgi:HAD superfamily hydrolase (TIGR01509 family)